MDEERPREPRKAQTAKRRRRRDTLTSDRPLKMAIPEAIAAKLAKDGRSARWVNDTGNRMTQLTKLDDWDKVAGVEPLTVGTNKDGKPILSYLCSKPIEFIDEDRKASELRRRQIEEGMVKGKVLAKTEEGDKLITVRGQMGAEVYVDKATSIGRGNQVIE